LSFLKLQIPRMEELYGIPIHKTFNQPMTDSDMAVVTGSMKNGRAHDITLYIRKDDEYIFIAKHFYPQGLFRAPSGGVNLGEDFIVGAKREAMEETGVEIKLEKYVMRIEVRFESENQHVDWTSHIFTANYLNGEIIPQDINEIREARLVKPSEISGLIKIMAKSDLGGLVYRSFLTTEMQKLLQG